MDAGLNRGHLANDEPAKTHVDAGVEWWHDAEGHAHGMGPGIDLEPVPATQTKRAG